MNNTWEESDQSLPPPAAKTPRHLQGWIALGLCVMVLVGLGVQSLLNSHAGRALSADSSQQQGSPLEVAQEPSLGPLKELLAHQQAEVPMPVQKSHPPTESTATKMERLEADKQKALVASSPMLAINRSQPVSLPESQPVLSQLQSPTKAVNNLLPGGISSIPAGLTTRVKPSLAANQVGADAPSPPIHHLTPLKASNPASQRLVFEGTLIPAVLLTQITSDLPGMITAQVSEDVYDSLYGSFLAIPKGSRLIGEYASRVVTGQERIMASFHRLILPHGQSFSLDAMQSADRSGQSGMQDEVDTRFWKRLGGQFMTAGLARILAPAGSGSVTILGGSGNSLGMDAAGQILVDTTRTGFQGNASLGPVIVIKKGYPFIIMVNQDMDFSGVIP